MSAYVSHLPDDVRAGCGRVAGLGMNAEEMAANRQLSEHMVHNLNREPRLPYPDTSFDVALCTVSVQYLLHPIEVFRDVGRVLRPGGPFVVSFSNRCFPTKAIAGWLYSDDRGHMSLVRAYFERSACWREITTADLSPNPGRTDPLYAVWARRAPSGG
jgi:SAM-dependent methyltransferase